MSSTIAHIEKRKILVPKLRFKEFKGEWQRKKLGKIILKLDSGVSVNSVDEPISKLDEFGILKTSCISSGKFYPNQNKKIIEGDIKRAKLNPIKGSILISRMNTPQLVGHSGYIEMDYPNLFVPDRLWMTLIDVDSTNSKLLSTILSSEKIMGIISNIATGTSGSMKNISKPNFLNLEIEIPSLPEQNKIASFLSAVDEKIQQLSRKKELLESYKKGMIQQLFSGKLRFKDENGKVFPKWENRKLSDVLFEHKLNSTGKEEVFSVSVHKGLINQIEHLGRVFAAKNTANYNLVKPNDIIYTKSPTGSFPLGIIKQSKVNKNVIVSPLYGVFTPETPGLGYLLNVYFESPLNVKNYLSSIIQKGAKNTINITNTTFLSKKMKLPVSNEEQNKIGTFLSNIDLKIENVSSLISQSKTFKKGLLQQMFV